MRRHPFDPVAAVVGAVFVAAAVIVLAGGRLVEEGRILLPIGLVAFGVALLGQASHPRDSASAAPAPIPHGPPPTPGDVEATEADTVESPPERRTEDVADDLADDRPAAARPGPDFYFGAGWQPERPSPDRDPEGGP